jgi:prophage regulatory protein
MPRLLRLPEVMKATGLSRFMVYTEMRAHRFPKSVKLVADPKSRAVAWNSDDIDAWIASRLTSQGTPQ